MTSSMPNRASWAELIKLSWNNIIGVPHPRGHGMFGQHLRRWMDSTHLPTAALAPPFDSMAAFMLLAVIASLPLFRKRECCGATITDNFACLIFGSLKLYLAILIPVRKPVLKERQYSR